MRARIRNVNGMYQGEVVVQSIVDGKNKKFWKRVTTPCFTKWGAERELNAWRDKNYPKEFDI